MILAIDPATKTGWAAGRPGANPPRFGTRNLLSKRKDNGEKVSIFRSWLQQKCFEVKPTLIVFESPYIPTPREPRFTRKQSNDFVFGQDSPVAAGGPPPMNAMTLRLLLALVGEIESVAFELRVEVKEARNAEFVKFFTGKARWGGREENKAAVMKMCRQVGWDVQDSDQGDALALWAMAESIVSPGAGMRRSHTPLLAEAHKIREADLPF